MKKSHRSIIRWGRLLPVLLVYQQFGCLPDGAFPQVVAENIVLTSAIVVQSITSIFFNTLFGAI